MDLSIEVVVGLVLVREVINSIVRPMVCFVCCVGVMFCLGWTEGSLGGIGELKWVKSKSPWFLW
jgi:hypothetical protein